MSRHHRWRRVRGTKPVGVVVEEVPVTVGRASIARAITRRQSRVIRGVRGVEVKRVGRLIFDIHVTSPTRSVRAIQNGTDPTDGFHQIEPRVPPRSGTSARRLGVALEKIRAVAHLVVKAVIVAVTRGGIRASRTQRRRVPPGRRPRVSNQSLLFLQHDQKDLLTHTAGARNLINNGRRRFVCRPGVRRAHRVGGRRPRRLAIILQAHVSRPTGRHLVIQETLNLRRRHGIRVPKQRIRDDVPRLELRQIRCLGGRSIGDSAESDNTRRNHDKRTD